MKLFLRKYKDTYKIDINIDKKKLLNLILIVKNKQNIL